MHQTLKDLLDRLNRLTDPETDKPLGEISAISDVCVMNDGTLKIVYTPSSPCSPVAVNLGLEIKNAARAVGSSANIIVVCQGHMMDDLVNRLLSKV